MQARIVNRLSKGCHCLFRQGCSVLANLKNHSFVRKINSGRQKKQNSLLRSIFNLPELSESVGLGEEQ